MALTIQQLRALIAVVDRGSFTSAAHELGVSQSAVSHAIAGLERELAQVAQATGAVGRKLACALQRSTGLVGAFALLVQACEELVCLDEAVVMGDEFGEDVLGLDP